MTKPQLIRKSFPKNDVYDRYLVSIDKIEALTRITSDHDLLNDLDVAYLVLPLIDSIAGDILNCSGRSYLIKLGYSRAEANLLMRIFRNGLLHNTHLRRLVFKDSKEVQWAMHAEGGSGPWMPFHSGDKDKETGEWWFKPEKPFKYFKEKYGETEIYRAELGVTRLAAQLRHDLKERKKVDERTEIKIVIGEIIDETRSETGYLDDDTI